MGDVRFRSVKAPVSLMLQARACRIRILWRWFCYVFAHGGARAYCGLCLSGGLGSVAPEVKDKLEQRLPDSVGCALGNPKNRTSWRPFGGKSRARAARDRARESAAVSAPECAAFPNGALTRYLGRDAFVARGEGRRPPHNIAPLLTAAELGNASGEGRASRRWPSLIALMGVAKRSGRLCGRQAALGRARACVKL